MNNGLSRVLRRVSLPLGAALLIALGCSNATSSLKNCSRVQSIVNQEKVYDTDVAKTVRDMGFAPYLSGGYLDVNFYRSLNPQNPQPVVNYELDAKNQNQVLSSRRCTSFVGFDDELKMDQVRIWTAGHCVRPASDISYDVQLYGYGGYVTIPLTVKLIETVKNVRKETLQSISQNQLGVESRELFLRTFDTHEGAISRVGKKRCRELKQERYNNTNYQHSCFSMSDLTTFKASIDLNVLNDKQKRVLKKAFDNFGTIRTANRDVFSSMADFSEPLFYAAYDTLVKVRQQESIETLENQIDCENSANLSNAVCSVSALPGTSGILKDMSKKYFISSKMLPGGKMTFNKSFDPTHTVDSIVESFKTYLTPGANKNAESARSAGALAAYLVLLQDRGQILKTMSVLSDTTWALMNSLPESLPSGNSPSSNDKLKKLYWYSFQSNIRPGNGEGKLIATASEKSQEIDAVKFRWLPSFLTRKDSSGSNDINIKSNNLGLGIAVYDKGNIASEGSASIWTNLISAMVSEVTKCKAVSETSGSSSASSASGSSASSVLTGLGAIITSTQSESSQSVLSGVSAGKNSCEEDSKDLSFADRAMTVSASKTGQPVAPYFFEKTDSGTLATFLSFPVGVLSAVKCGDVWCDTEGVSMRPLPQSGETDDANLTIAGGDKPGGPGSSAGQAAADGKNSVASTNSNGNSNPSQKNSKTAVCN